MSFAVLIVTLLVQFAPEANPSTAPAAAAKPRQVCRMEEDSTSRIGRKRVCRLQTEIEAESDKTGRDLDKTR